MIAGLAAADPLVRREAGFAVELLGLSWEPLDEAVRAKAEAAVTDATAADPSRRRELAPALGAVAGDFGALALASWAGDAGLTAGAAARALGNWMQRTKKAWPHAPLPVVRGETEVRRDVAYALFRAAANGTKEAVSPLAAALADPDAEVRALACKGLGAAKDAGGQLDALGRLARGDADWRVRVEATRALAALSSAAPRPGAPPVEPARAALQLAVAEAAQETARGDDPKGAMTLYAALQSSADAATLGPMAQVALYALESARGAARGVRATDLARLECEAAIAANRAEGRVDRVERCGGDALPAEERPRYLARALGDIPVPGREARLAALLHGPDAPARALAAEALGKVGNAQALALLREALPGADGPVIANAADALAGARDAQTVAPLADALPRFTAPADAEIAQSILGALGRLKAAAAEPAIRPLLASPVAAVRSAAKDALAELGAPAEEAPPAAVPSEKLAPPPESKLVLDTEKGRVVIALARDEAPATARALADLARGGFYDGLAFHRVVPDFVAQGGDPRGDGWGGPGFALRCELDPLAYERGAVGMALAGKDTGGSQFFIVHAMQPHLEGRYTVVGRVVEGMDVVDRLLPGDRIVKARPEP